MNNENNRKSGFPLLLTLVLAALIAGLVVLVTMPSEHYLAAATSNSDPNVQELATLIPRKYDYNRPTILKLNNLLTSDPAVRQQARELSKVWVHTFYTRMNNYTHDFCFMMVDKEHYSLDAVMLAARAFQANGYKVSISDSGFYYIVEIAE